MTSPSNSTPQEGAVVIYDGECPFCRNYVQLLRLRSAIGSVRLVDAREGGPDVAQAAARGYDLDEGMLFVYGGRWYYGADALNMMAILSSPIGIFNRLNGVIFKAAGRSRFLYPFLRACRNATLRLLGKTKLRDATKPPRERAAAS